LKGYWGIVSQHNNDNNDDNNNNNIDDDDDVDNNNNDSVALVRERYTDRTTADYCRS
jgi:hypothetical protein